MNPSCVIALSATLLFTGEVAAQSASDAEPARPPSAAARDEHPAPAPAQVTTEPGTPSERIRYQPWTGVRDPETGRPAPLSGPPPPSSERTPALLFPGPVAHGGFGGPAIKLTRMLSAPAALVGVQGGWLIDHCFSVGLAAYGLASRHDPPFAMRVDAQPSWLELGYGGLRVGYLLQPHRLVHVGASVLVGPGGLVARVRRDDVRDDARETDHADVLMAVEPELESEVNVARFMRLALTASYRYLGAVDAPGLTSRKLSAPAGSIALRFGYF